MTARTSQTDPIRIAEVVVGEGVIGIAFCPGKSGPSLTGREWARDLGIDLDAIRAWGANAVVTLIEDHEFAELRVEGLGLEVGARSMDWFHLPIVDVTAPGVSFERQWRKEGARIREILAKGGRIFVHCKGGLGRAGTVAARLLVELGTHDAEQAIAAVRKVRPGALETREQEQYVASVAQNIDRAAGCLLGLAVGDAVGTTLEFRARDSYEHLTDMVGGGPFRLKPGIWTDDTSMALALADSLLASRARDMEFEPVDLIDRFVAWWQDGDYSPTGTCFDIGVTTSSALSRYLSSGEPMAGDIDPYSAGNGSLMRLAPVGIAAIHWERELTDNIARLQSGTTHAAEDCLDACAAYALMLRAAIRGSGFEESVRAGQGRSATTVEAIVQGSWREKGRDQISSSGYVAHSLEAALWCVGQTENFRDAVLLAANLGDDADTTAAITGQLAGALYGRSGIPSEWLDKLAWRQRLEEAAVQLAL